MDASLSIAAGVILGTANLCLLLFVLLRLRRGIAGTQRGWLLALIVLAGGVSLLPALPALAVPLPLSLDALLLAGILLLSGVYGGLTLADRQYSGPQQRAARALVGLLLLWWAGTVALLLLEPEATGWSRWLLTGRAGAAALFGTAGISLGSLLLLLALFYDYYHAPMPELANRIAFRTVLTAVYTVSAALVISGSGALSVAGLLLLFMVAAGAVYGAIYYRVLDVRAAVLRGVQVVSITITAWGLIFAVLYGFRSARITLDAAGTLVALLVALGVAVLLLPLRQSVEWLFRLLDRRRPPALSSAIAGYSQSIARAGSLEEVVSITVATLNHTLHIRRSALLLVNHAARAAGAVELIVMEAGGAAGQAPLSGTLDRRSPIFHTLAVRKAPFTRFDLEYAPVYRQAAPQELAFFRGLAMSAYVPVISENAVIGVLACGPKLDDTPYTRADMEMLMVIGHQVGTTFRSARLIDDLQHLNNSMRALNKRLQNAKTELEKLDSVKTDFITIASHELRTPLAQIRGYTDIIDSMNEQGLLKPGQTTQLVTSLRKATERMEDLISNMLDVSQIDVNALDLRFVRAAPETILRLALDPLKEAIEQRQLTVERSGFTGLPHIMADLQRMVQAFRNLILNAIKFTPDGGRIDISARLEPATTPETPDTILFSFKDTGVGISPADHDLIFEKFYRGFDTQLHSTGMVKFMGAGPGLGLTIARGIIEGHGGTIRVESPGHDMQMLPGTTFYVRLPVNPPSGSRRVLPFESSEQAAIRSAAETRRNEAVGEWVDEPTRQHSYPPPGAGPS
ncbi:MAG: GAF domain-containing sensor histidine kinase [Anaerolineae bacterium]|nr:GAF domain-containing sensor histidine kinase [Anaerolineae bacterium]